MTATIPTVTPPGRVALSFKAACMKAAWLTGLAMGCALLPAVASAQALSLPDSIVPQEQSRDGGEAAQASETDQASPAPTGAAAHTAPSRKSRTS